MEDRGHRGTFVERNDWKAWVVLSLIFMLFAVEIVRMGGSAYAGEEAEQFKTITGTTWDDLAAKSPGVAQLIDYQLRASGAAGLAAALFSLAIAVFGLRRGHRWAWLTMWIWPAFLGLMWVLTPAPSGFAMGTWAIAIGIAVATLALSYRKYDRRDHVQLQGHL
jgi:hypothetical protein